MPRKQQGTSADYRGKKDDLTDMLIVERYKYILQEIHFLNENAHKFITLFQTLTTAILGGGIALLASWENLKIPPQTVLAILRSLEGLLILLTTFVVVTIIAGISSWFAYRQEETELLNKAIHPEFRKSPRLRSFWRWSETYLLLFMIALTALVVAYIETKIVPLF